MNPERLGNTEADRVLELARDISRGEKPMLTSNQRMNETAADIAHYIESPYTREIEKHNLVYLFALSFIPRRDGEK